MKSSHNFCPQTTFAPSVTSFTCLCTVCVWRGEFREDGSWSHLCRDEIPEFSVCHGLDHRWFRDRTECPVDHVEVFHCVEVWFRGNLEPPHLSTGVQLWPSSLDAITALVCVVDVIMTMQEQILRVSKVLVSVNDGISNLLIRSAEISWLDEHLVNVPSSIFARRLGFYGKPHRSIYSGIIHEWWTSPTFSDSLTVCRR